VRDSRRAEIARSFRDQAETCAIYGSAIYADLLSRAAEDVERGGPVGALVADFEGDARAQALALRVLGAVHALVLLGRAPELARFYPSTGGAFDPARAWPAFVEVVRANAAALAPRLAAQVQTNEVGRCAPLACGMLSIAEATGLPLGLREIGASAGLNLLLDRFRYELGPHRFGDAAAPLRLRAQWSGPPPPLSAKLHVASRAGCDVAPIDLLDPDARLRLEAFVWPDQTERLALLRAAIAAALPAPPPVVRASAAEFVCAELAAPGEALTTVVYHSVVWGYLPRGEQDRIRDALEAAGDRASARAPLAWLRLEGDKLDHAELRLTLWPGGGERRLARAHYHGSRIDWL
jgi:hypothetical protein